MVQLLRLLCGALIGLFLSSARREAEILVLRQQINVLRRKSPKRPALNNADRLLFVWLSRLVPTTLAALVQTVGRTLAMPVLGGLHHLIFQGVSFRQGQVSRGANANDLRQYRSAPFARALNRAKRPPLIPRECLRDLACDPVRGRMRSDVDPDEVSWLFKIQALREIPRRARASQRIPPDNRILSAPSYPMGCSTAGGR